MSMPVPPSPRKLSLKSMPSPRKLMSKTLKSVRGKRSSEKSAAKILSSPATTLKKLLKSSSSRKNYNNQTNGGPSLPSMPLMDLEEGDEEAHKERERLEEEREKFQQEIQNDQKITELPSPEETMLKKVEGLTAIAPPNLLLSDDEDDGFESLRREFEDQTEADETEVGEARTEEEAVPTKSERENKEVEDEDEDDESSRRTSVTASPKSPGRRKSKKSKKSKRRRKKKKAVSFAEGVLVYTDTREARERQAMFYSEQEMDDFRQDVAFHASVLMSNNPDNGDYVLYQAAAARNLPQHEGNKADESNLCLLGVEHHFLNETYKQKQKLKAILAVLMEQDRQYKEDGHFTPVDDVEMSKCYQRVSRISHKEAHERGLRSLMRDGEGQAGGDTEPSSSTSSLYSPASPMSVADGE